MRGICYIPLTRGEWATVSLSDAARVLEFSWHLQFKEGHLPYAARTYTRSDGKRRTQELHRFLLDAEKGQLVDHENGVGLDNRRQNLRFADKSKNGANSRKRKGCTSQFKGVYFASGKWNSESWAGGKKRYLGRFDTEQEAAKAYDVAAKETFGGFAKLNFPI